MPDKGKTATATPAAPPVAPVVPAPAAAGAPATNGATGTVPPKRSPGHRGQDVKDTVAEMAAKAHEISLEAGSKMAAAMKDVVNAAAGLTSFAIESARDLVQYMLRRGQMTQDEADKLIREAEEFQSKRKVGAKSAPAKPAPTSKSTTQAAAKKPAAKSPPPKKPAAKAPAKRPAAKAAKKPVAKAGKSARRK